MRYEKKFLMPCSQKEIIYAFLIGDGFFEQHPNRIISSIYYDTNELDLYSVSEAGLNERTKRRLRWYGRPNSLNLEYKSRKGDLGSKELNKYFLAGKENSLVNFFCSFKKITYKFFIPESLENIFFPKLAISYLRTYLISSDNLIRITLDQKIKCSKIISKDSELTLDNWLSFPDGVIEMKYARNDYIKSPLGNKIDQSLSLITERYSKYCKACSMIF